MNTTIPTPLTEDEILESPISSDEAGSQMVHAEFARQLERALVTEEECGIIKKEEIERLNTLRRAMWNVIRQIYDETEGYADGAPDASAHDSLANRISGIARQFALNPP